MSQISDEQIRILMIAARSAEHVLLCRRALGEPMAYDGSCRPSVDDRLSAWPETERESRRDWAERCFSALGAVSAAFDSGIESPDHDLPIVAALQAAKLIELEQGECPVADSWSDGLYGTRNLLSVTRIAGLTQAEARAECAQIIASEAP